MKWRKPITKKCKIDILSRPKKRNEYLFSLLKTVRYPSALHASRNRPSSFLKTRQSTVKQTAFPKKKKNKSLFSFLNQASSESPSNKPFHVLSRYGSYPSSRPQNPLQVRKYAVQTIPYPYLIPLPVSLYVLISASLTSSAPLKPP